MDPHTATFLAACGNASLLGFLHGASPCEHSWPLLVPFFLGRAGRRAAWLSFASFSLGLAAAALGLAIALATTRSFLPETAFGYVEWGAATLLLLLGLVLVLRPSTFHFGHHGHACGHEHHHAEAPPKGTPLAIYGGLFAVGFLSMFVPCPTAAMLYQYALTADSIRSATVVFLVYALATSLAVGAILLVTSRFGGIVARLEGKRFENLTTRLAGAALVAFAVWTFFAELL